jgi:hypothetical protein
MTASADELEQLQAENERLAAALRQVRAQNSRLLEQQQSRPVTKPSLRFRSGRFRLESIPVAIRKLHEYHISGLHNWYNVRLTHGLGQLAVVDDSSVRAVYLNLLSFATGSTVRLAGLESFFLTCMHTTWLMEDEQLYRAGISIWQNYQLTERRAHPLDPGIVFLDRETSLFTFVPWEAFPRLHDDLLVSGFYDNLGIAGAVRLETYTSENPFGWSYSKCVGVISAVATAAGVVIGAAGGGVIAGPGGVATGAQVGGAAMGAFGALQAAIACSDDDSSRVGSKSDSSSSSTSSQPADTTEKENQQQQSYPQRDDRL